MDESSVDRLDVDDMVDEVVDELNEEAGALRMLDDLVTVAEERSTATNATDGGQLAASADLTKDVALILDEKSSLGLPMDELFLSTHDDDDLDDNDDEEAQLQVAMESELLQVLGRDMIANISEPIDVGEVEVVETASDAIDEGQPDDEGLPDEEGVSNDVDLPVEPADWSDDVNLVALPQAEDDNLEGSHSLLDALTVDVAADEGEGYDASFSDTDEGKRELSIDVDVNSSSDTDEDDWLHAVLELDPTIHIGSPGEIDGVVEDTEYDLQVDLEEIEGIDLAMESENPAIESDSTVELDSSPVETSSSDSTEGDGSDDLEPLNELSHLVQLEFDGSGRAQMPQHSDLELVGANELDVDESDDLESSEDLSDFVTLQIDDSSSLFEAPEQTGWADLSETSTIAELELPEVRFDMSPSEAVLEHSDWEVSDWNELFDIDLLGDEKDDGLSSNAGDSMDHSVLPADSQLESEAITFFPDDMLDEPQLDIDLAALDYLKVRAEYMASMSSAMYVPKTVYSLRRT